MKYTISVNDIREASIMPWSDDATKSYYSSEAARYPWGNGDTVRKSFTFGGEWVRCEKDEETPCCYTPGLQKVFGGDIL